MWNKLLSLVSRRSLILVPAAFSFFALWLVVFWFVCVLGSLSRKITFFDFLKGQKVWKTCEG